MHWHTSSSSSSSTAWLTCVRTLQANRTHIALYRLEHGLQGPGHAQMEVRSAGQSYINVAETLLHGTPASMYGLPCIMLDRIAAEPG